MATWQKKKEWNLDIFEDETLNGFWEKTTKEKLYPRWNGAHSVDEVRDPGFVYSNKLDFSSYITEITQKAQCRSIFILKVFKTRNLVVHFELFRAYVRLFELFKTYVQSSYVIVLLALWSPSKVEVR